MRKTYRMFLRGEVFWCQNNGTGKQETLRTKDRARSGAESVVLRGTIEGLGFCTASNSHIAQPHSGQS